MQENQTDVTMIRRLTFIARGSIWPNNRFLHIGTFEFRDQRARNVQPTDRIRLFELESELFGVVIDVLNAVQCQTDKALSRGISFSIIIPHLCRINSH